MEKLPVMPCLGVVEVFMLSNAISSENICYDRDWLKHNKFFTFTSNFNTEGSLKNKKYFLPLEIYFETSFIFFVIFFCNIFL